MEKIGNKLEYKFQKETYEIIGACFEVHKILGCGFLEGVYQEALAIEFINRGVPFEQKKELEIQFKGVSLKTKYYPDFICYDNIIVEIKAICGLIEDHVAQTLNYLQGTHLEVGLLVNFGERSLKYKRIVA